MRAMRPRRKPQPDAKPAEKAAPTSATPPVEKKVVAKPPREEDPPREGLQSRLHREMLWFDNFLRRWLVRLMVIGTHVTIALIACYCIVWTVARGRSYDTVEQTPLRLCGVVLGAVPKVDGRENTFFTSRIQAAADLYHGGKLQYLIVSGDPAYKGQDQPTEMKEALISKGVPANKIYCDYGGIRTLDSIVRADRIFGQQQFTIISQAFHNPRALYIARRKGLVDCVAYNAPGVNTGPVVLMHLRELAARVMAILDVEFLKTEPKLTNDKKIEIGEKHPPMDVKPAAGR
jgi:SanA protein